MDASCLINTEDGSVIYSYDLVGRYVVGGQRFLLSLLCNQ